MTKAAKPGWLWPLIVGFLIRVLYPWYGHGFHHMDEHWQVIEPANGLIHGAWSKSWEWLQGDRSWIYPWLVSLPMRAAEALGFSEPIWIVAFTRAVHGAFAALAIPIVYKAVDKCGHGPTATRSPASGDRWARLAAWVAALWPYAIFCGTRTQGDMASAPLVLAGVFAPALVDGGSALAYALAGACFGAAALLKIDVAVAGAAFGLAQLALPGAGPRSPGRLARCAALAAGVAPFALAIGLVDRLTWGSWFHSVTSHASSNLVKGVGNQWGTSPWFTHALYFLDLAGAPLVLSLAALLISWRDLSAALRAGWITALVFVGTYMTVPHKEKRFLAPLVLLAIALEFATLARAARRVRLGPPAAKGLTIAIALAVTGHGLANAVTYLVRRPWWNRISAMRDAGRIDGIEKMLSPEWPAIFYLPRGVPAESCDADPKSLATATQGLKTIGVALDWEDLGPLAALGFRCTPSGETATRPPGEPRAYRCVRRR